MDKEQELLAIEAAEAAFSKSCGGLLDGRPMENAVNAYLAARSSSDEQRAEVVGWTGRRGDYPPGTKAFSIDGGHWTRVEGGWKWHMGDVFPSLGADAFKIEILASPVATGGVTVTDAAVERALSALWKAQGLGWSQHIAMRSALNAALGIEK